MNAFQKADRLVGSNELSRGANAIINTARAEKDASSPPAASRRSTASRAASPRRRPSS
jgi:hypothetical protein